MVLLTTYCFFPTIVLAQFPGWQWSKNGSSSDVADIGHSVTMDASGNVYVTGYFESASITFGSITLTNADYTGTTADIFVVKYDPSGTVLWANSYGEDMSSERGNGISADPTTGDIYFTGYFWSSTITFGSTTLTNAGMCDMFVVKCNSASTVLWAINAGGTNVDNSLAISTDATGDVSVAGYFGGATITFGSTTLTNASSGTADLFVVKYNSAGDVYATGFFYGTTIVFGSTTLTNASAGSADIFVVKV